jgi:hypothetical protein
MNCGSIFEPGLRADYEHIKVRCPFCHYEAVLVSFPDWDTPEQYYTRTGKAWPNSGAVYLNAWFSGSGKSVYVGNRWQIVSLEEARRIETNLQTSQYAHFTVAIICATEAGPPPENWRPE